MKVLLTGRSGQLGQALMASAPDGVELVATSRAELDLADSAACRRIVEEQRSDWVLNAGPTPRWIKPSRILRWLRR